MLTPLRDSVYIAPIFDPDKTKGGIYIPDQAKERCDQGTVKYIGPKAEFVQAGDHVLFPGYDGTLLRIDGEGLLIVLPESQITAILNYPAHAVSGVFFEDRKTKKEVILEIDEIMSITKCNREDAQELWASGYQKERHYPATYEHTITLLSEAVTNADWKSTYRFVDRMSTAPRREELFKNSPWLKRENE